jgi:hypothetical protein
MEIRSFVSEQRIRVDRTLGRGLDDVPVLDDLTALNTEDLSERDRGCVVQRNANMQKHHVAFGDGAHDLPFRLRWRRAKRRRPK